MHPSTEAILKFFEYEHLPPELKEVSKPFHDLAHAMAGSMICQVVLVGDDVTITDGPVGLVGKLEGPELTAGLRKLLESKDCFVRAALP